MHLHLGDSRRGLGELTPSDGPTFFYLDAHGGDDLPLLDEVDLAFTRWPRAVVMVDDFAVPADPGYGFDEGLDLDHLADRAAPPTAIWFPTCPATEETGDYRRGCVVLARAPELVERIDALPTLRRWVDAPRPTAGPGSASAVR